MSEKVKGPGVFSFFFLAHRLASRPLLVNGSEGKNQLSLRAKKKLDTDMDKLQFVALNTFDRYRRRIKLELDCWSSFTEDESKAEGNGNKTIRFL